MSLFLVACGGNKTEAAPSASVPPAPPTAPAPKVTRDGPAGTAPREVSGVATMTRSGEYWSMKTDEGMPMCPPDGLFEQEGYAVRYAGTMRPPRPNVRVRCAAVEFTSLEPAGTQAKEPFSKVTAELGEGGVKLWLDPKGEPVEACLPTGLRAQPGARYLASGHKADTEAKSCALMVFTALEPVPN
jgi:hypothetical protein